MNNNNNNMSTESTIANSTEKQLNIETIEEIKQENEIETIEQIKDEKDEKEIEKEEEIITIEENPWSMTFENSKTLLKEFTESSMRIHRLSDEIHEFCSTITSLTYK